MLEYDPKRVIQDAQYCLPYHHIPPDWKWEYAEEYESYLAEVVSAIRQIAPPTLLDVGCGDGRLLKELGFGMGCDLSWPAVRWAQALGLNAIHCDAAEIDREFDLVTAIEVLEHIPDDGIKRFVNVLSERTKGGVLVCVPTTEVPVSAKHYRHYDEDFLACHMNPFKPIWVRRIIDNKHILSLWKR